MDGRASITVAQCGPHGLDTEWLDGALSRVSTDLLVLPELANGAYFPLEPRTEQSALPETLDGPFIRTLGDLARRHTTYVLTGIHLADEQGSWNAAVLLDPDGRLLPGLDAAGSTTDVYRKAHLCNLTTRTADFREDEYFSPGEGHVVWDTSIGRLGCLICYDRHFPEAWRSLRRAGVDIVAVPVASPATSRAWFVPEMQAMALQQGVYAAAANRAGTERLPSSGTTTEYAGLSCIVAPDGSVLAEASFGQPNELAHAEADAELLARMRRENTFFDDRRDELYRREAWTPEPDSMAPNGD